MGTEAERADVASPVVGEEPYAAPHVDDLGEVEALTLGSLQDA